MKVIVLFRIILIGIALALFCIYVVDTLTIYGAIVLLGLTLGLMWSRKSRS